jgi:hypothetical protein
VKCNRFQSVTGYCVCVCMYVYACVSLCMYVCMCVRVVMYLCMYILVMYVCVYVRVYIYLYMCVMFCHRSTSYVTPRNFQAVCRPNDLIGCLNVVTWEWCKGMKGLKERMKRGEGPT